MAELSEVLESLAGRLRQAARFDSTIDVGAVLHEAAGVLDTLAATQVKVTVPVPVASPDLWKYRSELAEAIGIDFDEDDVPDSWAELLNRVEQLRTDRTTGWQAATTVAKTADRYRNASGAGALATQDEVVARIADRAQLVSTLARSLGLSGSSGDVPDQVVVAVANLKAHRDRLAKQLYDPSAGRGHVANVLKALGTWSPGHEVMDTAELADAAVYVAGELVKDAEAYRRSAEALTEDRGKLNGALGLGWHAPLADALVAIAQLRSSALDSPDGLADRVADALGVDTDSHRERPGGAHSWTDESLAWLVDQVRETVADRDEATNTLKARALDLGAIDRAQDQARDWAARADAAGALAVTYEDGLRTIACPLAGGEPVTETGAALVERIEGIVASLVRHNEAGERETEARALDAREGFDGSEQMRERVADALGFSPRDLGRDWSNLLKLAEQYTTEHREHAAQIAALNTADRVNREALTAFVAVGIEPAPSWDALFARVQDAVLGTPQDGE